MKKIYTIILFLICLLPLSVSADNTYIDKYFIEMNIKDDGDVLIRELFIYKGNFNGAYKKISLKTESSDELFIEPSMYTPTNVKLVEVKDIKVDNSADFSYLNKEGIKFTENPSATSGSSGYYTITKTNKDYEFKIFNPGSYKGFYIEYVLEGACVNHNDISELWLNIFKDNADYANNIEIIVNIPNNEDILRAWAHGSLNGNIEIVSKKQVKFSLANLYTGDDLDIRLVFDKINASKHSNIEALNEIINYEMIYADKANMERELYRKYLEEEQKKEELIGKIYNILGTLWIIGLILLIIFIYKKYDKEYISEFKGKYFRDIPNDNNPIYVGYLMYKTIGTKELSSTILSMINKKNIDFIDIDKKDYLLKINNMDNLDELELEVMDLLFKQKDEIKLSEFKKNAKDNYDQFLIKYNDWNSKSLSLAKTKNYYEKNTSAKFLSILYSLMGLTSVFMYNDYCNSYLFVSIIIVSIISLIYFTVYTKRTRQGNEEYLKWVGLKNFMNDFGKMNTKELPEVKLWEKYLVYAVTLGCASKLIKTMKIKLKEVDEVSNIASFDNNLFVITNMNSIISTSVNSAVASAKSVAASQNSSGSGSGGGFSSDGGFSGGGGGSTGHF